MRLLFAISVASFCTVLWIALALARRIERDRLARKRTAPAPQRPATEFFEAGEYRTPRPMRTNQQVVPLRARPIVAEPVVAEDFTAKSIASTPLDTEAAAPSGPIRHLWPSPPVAAQALTYGAPTGDSRRIIDSTIQLVQAERPWPVSAVAPSAAHGPAPAPAPQPRDLSGERKSPQSARSGAFRRVDLSHYNNEDMGDLTDPYTHIVRPSGVRRAVKNI